MNPSEKHTLEIDSVELSFGDRRILSGVYLAVETGGVSAVLGRNGCGKSCLMKILCGSLRAGFRSMRIDGVWHDRFRADEVRSGCPSGLAVFGTLVLGAHAYATTELEGGGLQHIVKQLGYGDDPLNQRASVGWKAVKTAERLSEQYMVRIESCSARYSAKAKAN